MTPFAGRTCVRVSCRSAATMTLTFNYAESIATLGPIATFSEPHAYDLCERHASKFTVPNGWRVERESISDSSIGPTEDDLMAIADAVREVARPREANTAIESSQQNTQVGRRGHLRAVPS